jgi:hypothetical protein
VGGSFATSLDESSADLLFLSSLRRWQGDAADDHVTGSRKLRPVFWTAFSEQVGRDTVTF